MDGQLLPIAGAAAPVFVNRSFAPSMRRRGSSVAAARTSTCCGDLAPLRPDRRRWTRARAGRCRRRSPRSRAPRLACGRALTSTATRSSTPSGPKRRRGQRDRTVGSSRSGCAVTRMKIEADGGSSSVLSSAFCAAGTSASAPSMMTTRQRPRTAGTPHGRRCPGPDRS